MTADNIGVNLPARLSASLAQRLNEALAIRIIHEDPFAPVTAIHDVINRAGILDSQLAGHDGKVALAAFTYQYQELTPFSSDLRLDLGGPPLDRHPQGSLQHGGSDGDPATRHHQHQADHDPAGNVLSLGALDEVEVDLSPHQEAD